MNVNRIQSKTVQFLTKRLHLYVETVLLLALFAGPFFWLLSTAFKADASIFALPPQWIPENPTIKQFERALFEFPFMLYLRNTFIIAFVSAVGYTFSSSLVAFAIARLHWPDSSLIFMALLATMMIPGQTLLIPHFLIFRQLNWIDTFLPLIVPSFLGSAFYIFLLRQFFMTIPESYIESARVDGARSFRIFWQIILPLSKPAMVTVFILSLVGGWNDFMGPLIYLSSETTKTLAVGLSDMRGQFETNWGMMMAAAAMMTTPIILLFFFFQRAFIEGISLSGLKG